MNTKPRKILLIVCAGILLVSLVGIAWLRISDQRENRVDEQVAGLVGTSPSPAAASEPTPAPDAAPEPTATPAPQVLEKYAALYAENPDIIGWLKIDGTDIDYAVMQSPEEPDKYLHLDFYGSYSNRGSLYLDAACDIWTSDNLIIYGHHMKNGSMFGSLEDFADADYWQEHPYIQFDTIYEEQTYEIVGAFYTRVLYQNEEGFRYYQFTDAAGEAEFDEYADFIRENAAYDTGVTIAYGDRLLTLSTCSYQTENGRFAVVAKRISPENSPAPDDGGA